MQAPMMGRIASQEEVVMKVLPLLLAASAVGACTMGPQSQTMARTPLEQEHLEKLVAGKVAGPAISCLPNYRANDMVVVDENTIAFRNGRRQVYINHMQGGGCLNIDHGRNTLVTKTIGSGLCSGDIAQVVDLNAGIPVGSCVFGEFIPFSTPRS
jgi:hypothetical protein